VVVGTNYFFFVMFMKLVTVLILQVEWHDKVKCKLVSNMTYFSYFNHLLPKRVCIQGFFGLLCGYSAKTTLLQPAALKH
jgi:hypothetical protein